MFKLITLAYFSGLKQDILKGCYYITDHATIRMSQRGVSLRDLQYSVESGQIQLVQYQFDGRDPKLEVRCVRRVDGREFNATFALVLGGFPVLVTVETPEEGTEQ